jgi:hypothetical protein
MSDHYHDRLEFIADELERIIDEFKCPEEELQEVADEARRTAEDLRSDYEYNTQDVTIMEYAGGVSLVLEGYDGEKQLAVSIDQEDSFEELERVFERMSRDICVFYSSEDGDG